MFKKYWNVRDNWEVIAGFVVFIKRFLKSYSNFNFYKKKFWKNFAPIFQVSSTITSWFHARWNRNCLLFKATKIDSFWGKVFLNFFIFFPQIWFFPLKCQFSLETKTRNKIKFKKTELSKFPCQKSLKWQWEVQYKPQITFH